MLPALASPMRFARGTGGSLIRELDRLQEIETEQDGKQFVLRTPVTGDVGRVFKAVGVALPPNIREADAVAPAGN